MLQALPERLIHLFIADAAFLHILSPSITITLLSYIKSHYSIGEDGANTLIGIGLSVVAVQVEVTVGVEVQIERIASTIPLKNKCYPLQYLVFTNCAVHADGLVSR